MAGLQNALQPQPQPQAQAMEVPEGTVPGDAIATPEEQAIYDGLVARAFEVIFVGDDADTANLRPEIIEALSDGDPAEDLGEVAGTVFARVMQAAREDDVEMDEDLEIAAGAEVFVVLAQAMTYAGLYDFEQDDEAFNAAWLIAADQYRRIGVATGAVDMEKEQAAFQDVVAADQDGRLDAMMAQLGGAA